jgi:hypothetical protein
MSLYIGSCRYMNNLIWKSYFPPRLHTTKEIIYFLNNINKIDQLQKIYNDDLLNIIFGDCYHESVKKHFNNFVKNIVNWINNIDTVCFEISSRKLYYYNDIPVNYFYTTDELIKKYNLRYHILTDCEIKNDIIEINNLAKNIFNKNTQLMVITHIDLKLKSTNDYITDRHTLVNAVNNICHQLSIKCVNPGLYFQQNGIFYFENIMKNDTTHYSKKGKQMIHKYLINKIK